MQRLWLAAAFAALAGITLWPGLDPFAGSSYRVVHGWPQAPEGSPFAGVAGVDVDSRHRVFIFQRTDPPILCFDGATGKLLASWGEAGSPSLPTAWRSIPGTTSGWWTWSTTRSSSSAPGESC